MTSSPHPRPLSPKRARGEITRDYALAPLGERASVSRRTGEGVGLSRDYVTLNRLTAIATKHSN